MSQGRAVTFSLLRKRPIPGAITHPTALDLSSVATVDSVSNPEVSPDYQPQGLVETFPWVSLESLTPAVLPVELRIVP